MKTYRLTGLDEVLKEFTGEPIKVTNQIEECPKCGLVRSGSNQWTITDALTNMLSKVKKEGQDAFALYDTGMRLYQAEGAPVTLQEHPFTLLEEVVQDSPFTIAITVPIRRCLERARNEAESKEVTEKTQEALAEKLEA